MQWMSTGQKHGVISHIQTNVRRTWNCTIKFDMIWQRQLYLYPIRCCKYMQGCVCLHFCRESLRSTEPEEAQRQRLMNLIFVVWFARLSVRVSLIAVSVYDTSFSFTRKSHSLNFPFHSSKVIHFSKFTAPLKKCELRILRRWRFTSCFANLHRVIFWQADPSGRAV